MPSPPLTSSTQATAGTLSESVVNRGSRTIDLSAQRGAIDHHVLDQLRNALHLNDFFIRLSLANNPLRDNCIAAVCAILKDQNYIASVSLENCDLLDKDVTYYVVPALLSRSQVRYLDLSKNMQLTDAVAEALASLIREGELLELRLVGVPLTRKSGKIITDALARNGSLGVCELPYTIGFEAIDEAARFIQRNLRHKRLIKEQEGNKAAMEQMVYGQREALTATRVAIAMEMHTSKNQPPGSATANASGAGTHVSSVGDCASGSPLAALGGTAAGERQQLARYYTEHGRKNALLVAPLPRATPGAGRPGSVSKPVSARGEHGVTPSSSRGPSRGQTRGGSTRQTSRASSSNRQPPRLPSNPPLVLPPVRTAQPAELAPPARAARPLLMSEAEWQARLDPATSRSMRCLDLLGQPGRQDMTNV